MKVSRLKEIAREVTVNNLGPYDDCIDETKWLSFESGVLSGLLEFLNITRPLVNQAISVASRPQKPDRLKKEINNFNKHYGDTGVFDK